MPKLKTTEHKVETYVIKLHCEDCGGEMTYAGVIKTSNPPWYVHKCEGCGKVENVFNARFPHVEHREPSD